MIKLVFTLRRRPAPLVARRFLDLPSAPLWLGEEHPVVGA